MVWTHRNNCARTGGQQFKRDSGATFLMGDNLEQLITDPVTYINVAEGPYWETRVDWIFIGNSGLCTEDHRMVLDTGTSTVNLPGDIHMAINNVLGIWRRMHHVYVFDCERLPDLPPITFQIQGKRLQIMPRQYTIQVDNLFRTQVISRLNCTKHSPLNLHTTTNGVTTCYTRFQNTSSDYPVGIILGMSFLHSFQLIFDDHAGTVGFSERPGRSSIS
ncbi:hypothetical protein T265_09452 [Opisthorchis viverrini]|uniref:Peptidase A1 domain-containing protein n=1 Tax=Opisthorchis viverrini TaxID=6198 RepID=A0A074ZGW2_OPIVI|nr:hypothetical protein T265_09452 [Opisthorchis viverrini]KER22480.1 hypothetical protein T265_09452 [Opisthorchis viverrini]